MNEAFDRDLARLFDQTHETLPAAEFSFGVEQSIRHARRRSRFWRVVIFVDLLVGALLVTPYVMDGSVAVADYLSIAIADLGGALMSPYGMGCSLVFGAWFLRRVRRLAA
jgi:hypothetical protein